MALGGGNFAAHNEALPGTYINFIQAQRADVGMSERGVVTMAMELDWGPVGDVIECTRDDFAKRCMALFGYENSHDKMRPLREAFKNARKCYVYRLGNKETANYAACSVAQAIYPGICGDKISFEIKHDPDKGKNISTYYDGKLVDHQYLKSGDWNVKNNEYIAFFDTMLFVDSDQIFSFMGGSNPAVNGLTSYNDYLNLIETYNFNIIICPIIDIFDHDTAVRNAFAYFTENLRDKMGFKFQCVMHAGDRDAHQRHEGIVLVENKIDAEEKWELVYWVAGLLAGTNINESALNKLYDGEYDVNVDYTQNQLKAIIEDGKFALHRVGPDKRVLADINSLTEYTDVKGELFSENQTIRVLDQIAVDTAVIFNTRYLGTVPNDESGRLSLWSDIVKMLERLQDMRAIENFNDGDVKIEQGNTRRSVAVQLKAQIVNAMAQLYMTVYVG